MIQGFAELQAVNRNLSDKSDNTYQLCIVLCLLKVNPDIFGPVQRRREAEKRYCAEPSAFYEGPD